MPPQALARTHDSNSLLLSPDGLLPHAMTLERIETALHRGQARFDAFDASVKRILTVFASRQRGGNAADFTLDGGEPLLHERSDGGGVQLRVAAIGRL
jgi:hypothetical protein